MPDILALVDHVDGELTKTAAEVITAARARSDGAVHVAAFGPGAEAAGAGAGAYGATTAYCWADPAATGYVTEPQVAALQVAVAASQAPIVLYPDEPLVGDVVARAAVRLGTGVVTEASDIELDGDVAVAIKHLFGGELTARCAVTGGVPQFVAIRPNAFAAQAVAADEPAEVVALDVAVDTGATRAPITEVAEADAHGVPSLTEAPVVCAGGRGMGGPEGFGVVQQLAEALGGAVGASRPAVDAGWWPGSGEIGLTGVSVAPRVYLAAGISGAVQHRVGMQTADTIVAVNTDPGAEIFAIADVGVVGDAHQVLPRLLERIRQRHGHGGA